MDKKIIAVIFGGCSPEHGVSLESAAGVLSCLDRSRFEPVMLGITRSGEWYRYVGDIAAIADGTWTQGDCTPACICPDRGSHELLLFRNGSVGRMRIDAVFPVLHGRNGEDGTVQGLCELAGLPLVGCGTLASALCMDKFRAHEIVSLAGVRVPEGFTLAQDHDRDETVRRAGALGWPVFVKPVKAGSSFGVARIGSAGELLPAIDAAFFYDDRVIVEQAIPGFEVGCAVMGDAELTVGVPDEIELAGGFFDFREKYGLITSKIHVPARVPDEKLDEIRCTAETVYRALDCRGFARVDMFLTPEGGIVFNEVNTIPGFTPHSRFPGMMRAAGIETEQLVTRLIEEALE